MTDPPASRSSPALIARLAAMMFLQYWSLGLWMVTVPTFIAAHTQSEGDGIFSAGFSGYSASASALGALAAPIVFGWIADRFLSAHRLMTVLHAAAAAALWGMIHAKSQPVFFMAMVLYFQVYSPSVSLTNTIALKKLANKESEFPLVRIAGTLGWISAGVFVGAICLWWFGVSVEATRTPLRVAFWSHLVMSLYSTTLPSTPPDKGPPIEGRASAALTHNGRFLLFLMISMLVAATTQPWNLANTYLNRTGWVAPAATQVLGQTIELGCLSLMVGAHRRLKLKTLFVIGVLCWTLRYTLVAAASYFEPGPWGNASVLLALLVHGPAYVFVYITGQMYIDRLVKPENRGTAQGMHTVATGGLGHLLGAGLSGWAQSTFLTPPGVSPPPYDWTPFWLVPVVPGLLVAVLFLATFSEAPREVSSQ